MKLSDLSEADHALIEHALAEFDKELQHDWHGVACAIRLQSGRVVSGLVLEATVPSLTVCAELVVLGKAMDEFATDPVKRVVAVRARETSDHKVIPPCGRCREFLTDYCPDASVIVSDQEQHRLVLVSVWDLLPFKYRREAS